MFLHRNYYKSLLIASIFLVSTSIMAPAQIKSVGLPFVNKYDRASYDAGTQNWAITQSSEGTMFFANNEGVLAFDGSNWNLYPLPNKSVVKSVAFFNNKLYAGGFNEFGYFSLDSRGRFTYTSIYSSLPENMRELGEIWGVFSTQHGIVFQSFQKIIIINNDEIIAINPPSEYGFSYFVNNELYIVDRETGLYKLKENNIELIYENSNFFIENDISFIIPNNSNSLLIGTTNNGIYSLNKDKLTYWNVSINEDLIKQQIYTGASLPEKQIAIGTIQDGLYVIDYNGKILLHINKNKGLQNNTVLSQFLDKHNNLWLGLDNGIDALEISSPFSRIYYQNSIGSSYASIVHNEILYIGTNQGLFARRISRIDNHSLVNEDFRIINNTKGQVWSLKLIDDILLCGHNFGTFIINDFTAKQISDVKGGWDYAEIPWDNSKVLGGVFNGLQLYKYTKGQKNSIKEIHQIKGFTEPCKELHFDMHDNLWVSHGYKGIFKLRISEDCTTASATKLYNTSNGLPELPYSFARIKGALYVVARDGLYNYDPNSDHFSLDTLITSYFGSFSNLTSVTEDFKGDLWYYASGELNVLRLLEDGTYTKISIPFKRIENQVMLSSFENIYVYDDNNVFIGSQEGILHYNPTRAKDYKIPFNTFLGEIVCHNRKTDSILFHRYFEINSDTLDDYSVELSYRYNSISFQYMSPFFEAPDKMEYSYRLKGFNDSWSAWSNQKIKEFTNLREGKYIFEVQARNAFHHKSIPASFKFNVRPPFYRSKLAYALMAIVVMFATYFLIWTVRNKIENTRLSEKQKHNETLMAKELKFKEEVQISKEEIEQLKNEKLRIEMRHKDMELANSTLNIIQKKKLLTNVKNDISNLIGELQTEANKQSFKKIIKKIDKEIRNETEWKVFNKYFDEVHQDFSKRLKEKHPDLTPNDIRMCCYLRMNISTKEIAPLLNISVRGVEISRYRLRKKMDLERESNLTEYIMSI